MNSEPDSNLIAKNLKDKIIVAAPLTMFMMTLLFERILLQNIMNVASISWFISVIGFFLISTFLMGYLIYLYMFIKFRCRACSNSWSWMAIRCMSIESVVYKISLIYWNISIKVDKLIKSYECNICNCIEHKKSNKYSLIKATHD
jgi:hypothetical protein